MGEPPNLEATHLLELNARGLDPEALRRAIQLAGDELERGVQTVASLDRQRILRHVTAVESDIARIEALAPTPDRHALFVKEVKELVDSARFASPVRAYEARFLGVFEPRREEKAQKIALPLALGIAAGIAGGYALAFLLAGIAAFSRHRRSHA